jgi:tRNA (adenine22-N1)-methyltransferase
VEDLRAFLADSGFAVLREQAAEEEGHIYTVMLVSYDPGLCKKDDLSLYIGKIDASTSENRNYLAKQITRLFNRASGLRTAGKIREAEEDLRRIERIKARFPACFS